MSAGVALLERPASPPVVQHASGGGVPARRAMVRWAWRLFRREWRQQILILAMVTVAVGAVVVGATVAVGSQSPATSGFGTAGYMATFHGQDAATASQIASLEHRFGPVDVIENQTRSVPGSIDTYDLRAQDPSGPYGGPMLSLLSGSYPAGTGQVALTPQLASELNLRVGDVWHTEGMTLRVVGTVENPQSLLDEFALVVPGDVANPSQTTVLFDAHGVSASSLGSNVTTPAMAANPNVLNPSTIVLTLATLGMLLIALVSVGGFTVLAQRRLRAIGMVESMGATDKNVRLVMRANGVFVGVVGALAGFALGFLAWLAYRPHAESSAHHLIGVFALPWNVIGPSLALAVLATFFASGRPARTIAKVPVVSALAGRPAPPKQLRRSAVPGIVVLVIAFFLFGMSGSSHDGGGTPELVLGFVLLIVGIILFSPLALSLLAKVGGHAPIACRLALRDLARYRARSGSALSAISLGIVIAVLICVVAAARYSNVLDYAGPNVASNQLIVYTPNGPYGPSGPGAGSGNAVSTPSLHAMNASVDALGRELDAQHVVALDTTSATLNHSGPGRTWSGPIYVATPALLKAFGVNPSTIDAHADILSMRSGLSGVGNLQLVYGTYFQQQPSQRITPNGPPPGTPTGSSGPAPPAGSSNSAECPAHSCLNNPVIQETGNLPSGTSAPNTVLTEHAVHSLGLQAVPAGWLIQTPAALTAAQITDARQAAAAAGLTIETKNSLPTSGEITNWATVFGIVLALGVLAMSVGLIRSETAGDLRTLTATGASAFTRRSLTAVTAGALGLLGAVLGTGAAYVAAAGWLRGSSLNGGLSSLGQVPWFNLFLIVVGMPVAATVIGWLLAGREPSGIATRPSD
jgi:putative ABC transport system permease protein